MEFHWRLECTSLTQNPLARYLSMTVSACVRQREIDFVTQARGMRVKSVPNAGAGYKSPPLSFVGRRRCRRISSTTLKVQPGGSDLKYDIYIMHN